MAGRPRKYTDKQLVAALTDAAGMVYIAAGRLGCAVNTFYRRAEVSPDVAEAIDQPRGQSTDAAELGLRAAVLAAAPWAIKYMLSTQGRARGFGPDQGQDAGPGGADYSGLSDEELNAEIARLLAVRARAAARRGAPGPGV